MNSDILGFLVGFRKFTILLIFMALMAVYRYFDLVTSAEFASSLEVTVQAFIVGNLGEHLINFSKEFYKNKREDENG